MPLNEAVKLLITAPVLASSATIRLWVVPLTEVKSPPTKTRVPSADPTIARPWALRVGANPVSSAPVVMSYARMFERGVSLVPAAAPAGRALVNDAGHVDPVAHDRLGPGHTVELRGGKRVGADGRDRHGRDGRGVRLRCA